MGTKREGEKKRDRQGGRGGGWEESEKRWCLKGTRGKKIKYKKRDFKIAFVDAR